MSNIYVHWQYQYPGSLAWDAPHAPHEHEPHCVQLAHGIVLYAFGVIRKSSALRIRVAREAGLVLDRERCQLHDKEGGGQEQQDARGNGGEGQGGRSEEVISMQVQMVREVAFVFCIVMVIRVASLLIMFVYCHLMTCEKNFHFIFSFILLPTHIPACQNTVSPPFFLPPFFSFLSVPFLPCLGKSLPLRSLLVTCECPSCVTFFLCPDVFLPLPSSGGDW